MTTYNIFDISNLLYRNWYANKSEDNITIAGLALYQALLTLNKYFKQYNPDKIVMTFDRPNWRKVYTKSNKCLSGRIYKGNRRKDMTIKESEKYEGFLEHLSEFETLMKNHTSIICLAATGLEADDLVAGFCQMHSNDKITIVSTDKDFMQLLGNPNITLIDPATNQARTLDEYNNDAEYFMFFKNLRGDAGDGIPSAYPRVRKTKIEKAYNDPLERVNMMHETWINPNGKEFRVRDMFKENELLMDLRKQPEEIRTLITNTINETMENPGRYSYFDFLRFLGKFKMKKVSANLEAFTPMLNS